MPDSTPGPGSPGETPGGAPPRAPFTLDLSSGTQPAKAKRPKGFVPVVQQTVNLSTKRPEAPPAAGPDARAGAAPGASRRYDSRRDGPRHDTARPDGPGADGPARGEMRREKPVRDAPRRDAPVHDAPRRDAPRRNDMPDTRRSGPPTGGARSGSPRPGGPTPAPRPSGGTSLADLLDEATLARLRGK